MRATSQAVPVVPTFAPKTRPSPCGNVRIPALTRPIVVMVVALDDCTRSVTTAPQNAPDRGVAAALPSTVRSEEPASPLRPSVMIAMPSRNRPTPPRIEIVVDMAAFLLGMFAMSSRDAAFAAIECAAEAFPERPSWSALGDKLGAGGGELLLLLRADFRIMELETFHRFDDRRRDDQPSEPLVVRRYDIPRRVRRGGSSDRLLERVHVTVPIFALAHVRRGELPMLVGPVEALHEALLLFLARKVEEEFENDHSLTVKILLEMRDIREPFVPDALGHQPGGQLLQFQQFLVYPDNQDLFVIGPI